MLAPFKSTFAILDVKTGRKTLLKRVEEGEKIYVTIKGTIDCAHSRDDGVSREFSINVHSVRELGS